MRVFYGGLFKAVVSLFTGDSGGGQQQQYYYQQPTPDASAQIKAETDAANAAALKEQNETRNRAGARATVLTDSEDERKFGSSPVSRKTLFGG